MTMSMKTPTEVLRFWFGEASAAAEVAAAQSVLWWGKTAVQDQDIAQRFSALRAAAVAGKLTDWEAFPQGRLALILLIDQFSRNMFRDDPRAFADDALAHRWCVEGLSLRHDEVLRPIERVFFYLPLEHSESVADQHRCVVLMEALAAEVPQAERELFGNYVNFARAHARIIERFGRFPHRNAVLGRVSTDEEASFLTQPGSSF